MIIALDGPAGAGKSTVAREVATRLGFACLDTGAMFRSIALKALENDIALDDDEALGEMTWSTSIEFEYSYGDPYPSAVLLDGEDVTCDIRTYEIDNAVTPVCQQPSVREALLELQRGICYVGDYVVDGRDIGTVVFPDAEVKIYLDAAPEERARRRVEQNAERGVGSTDFATVLADVNRRDWEDMNRQFAPLMCADDAYVLDSTDMTLEEVIEKICSMA